MRDMSEARATMRTRLLPEPKLGRPKKAVFVVRVESDDGRRWKVSVRDIQGVVYWMAKDYPSADDAAFAGSVRWLKLRRMSESERSRLIAPGADELRITNEDVLLYDQWLTPGRSA